MSIKSIPTLTFELDVIARVNDSCCCKLNTDILLISCFVSYPAIVSGASFLFFKSVMESDHFFTFNDIII